MTNPLTVLDEGFVENLLEGQANPRPYYEELHRLAPVYRTPLGFWFVSNYDLAKEVYANPERWSVEPDDSRSERSWILKLWYLSLLGLDDPEHRRMRAFVSSLGTRTFLANLESAIDEVMAEQWAAIPGTEFDFKSDFAAPIGMKIIMRVLGVDLDKMDVFTAMSRTMRRVVDPRVTDQELADFDDRWRAASDAVLELADARRARPQNDTISELVRLVDSDELTENEMVSTTFLILVAGNETSSNSLVNGLYHLLANPELMQVVRDDRSLLGSAIEELLRYEAAAQNSVPRYAAEDMTLGGVLIRKGESLYVGNHPANHDATVFENASKIDLRRSPNRHIAFGFGVHHCLGAAIGRLEMGRGLESVLDRFSQLELASPEVIWESGFSRRGVEHLPVRTTPSA